MQPHQQRVVDEKAELDSRLEKLEAFFSGNIFPTLDSEEQKRLYVQAHIMHDYSAILAQRIAAF